MNGHELLRLTEQMVAIPSVSREEGAFVDWLTGELGDLAHLDVTRIGDNLIARTHQGRSRRLVMAGHTDTVPPSAGVVPGIEGDRLEGLGAADMKGGLAVMLAAAREFATPAVDVTYVFYAREEVAAAESGLAEVHAARPDLLQGDVALLGEPTDGAIEAGCQGTLRLRIALQGRRAHTARPWTGRNAIHRLGRLLEVIDGQPARTPEILGCGYREALQAVAVEGGVSGNVVPDRAVLTVNHRFAPDRTIDEATASVQELIADILEPDDTVEVVDAAPAAPPALDDPLIAGLVEDHGLEVRAKLGWTDVARFASWGVPALNLGPGDPLVAHTVDEYVTAAQLERVWAPVSDLLRRGGG